MYNILLADLDLVPLIKKELSFYNVDVVNNKEDFYTLTYKKSYELYIVNFYYLDIIEELKDIKNNAPILVIDEYYDINHLKKTFMIADDYIIKPIIPEELKARVSFQFRKLYNLTKDVIKYGTMYFHIKFKQLYNNNKKIKLSPNEIKLIEYFLCRMDKPISKEVILEFLETSSGGALRVYISKLKKLGFNITYDRANFAYTLHSKA